MVDRRTGGERSTRHRRQKAAAIAITLILAVAALGLSGCDEFLLPVAPIVGKLHKPDPLTIAYLSLRQHDCSVADREFSNFLAVTPDDARALAGKGDALICLDKYDDAIASYSNAVELDPKWFDYLGRGLSYRAKGDLTKALLDLNAGIALAPTTTALYVYRGIVLRAQGDTVGAGSDFDKVSHLVSDSPRGFNHYGWALATSPIKAFRHGDAAIQYATRACGLSFWKDANELDTLAAAYAEAGQFKKQPNGRRRQSTSVATSIGMSSRRAWRCIGKARLTAREMLTSSDALVRGAESSEPIEVWDESDFARSISGDSIQRRSC
jgi:tetratricopeptide (TPR) repeat protein